MTVRELINQLEDFGDDMKVLIDVFDRMDYLVVDNVDTRTVEGELIVAIECVEDVV